jgi:hypothetical protein
MFVKKASDTSRNTTTTLTADPDLKFPVEASKDYDFEILVWMQAAGATPDFKFTLVGPSGSTIWWGPIEQGANVYFTPSTSAAAAILEGGDPLVVAGSGTTGPYGLLLKGTVMNGATPGDVELHWAQNTSDGGNCTVKRPSRIKYSELP